MATFGDNRLSAAFWKRVKVEGDCWLWQAGTDQYGYGRFYQRGSTLSTHKLTYTTFVGPVPQGLELDHTCRRRNCCNPDHTEPVTHRVNVLRGEGTAAKHARQTECKRGHPFDAANTYLNRQGKRYCRTCRNQHARETYARQRAISNA